MLRISKVPEELVPSEVERLKTLELKSEKIIELRDNCYRAYTKYILAQRKSKEADKIIKEIEEGLLKNLSAEIMLEMKQEAEILLNESNKLLEQAGKLKDQCHGQMEEMEKPRNR